MSYKQIVIDKWAEEMSSKLPGLTLQGPAQIKSLEPGSTIYVEKDTVAQTMQFGDQIIVLIFPFPDEEEEEK